MADIKTIEQRSRNMSAIKGSDTAPEVYMRKLMFSNGYRYRKHVPYIPGRPDIYLAKYKTAVFVNGCFWHRHKDCKYAYVPKTNTEFWVNKIETNKQRDSRKINELQALGWRVIVVWEC